jgi:hypothetical protein
MTSITRYAHPFVTCSNQCKFRITVRRNSNFTGIQCGSYRITAQQFTKLPQCINDANALVRIGKLQIFPGIAVATFEITALSLELAIKTQSCKFGVVSTGFESGLCPLSNPNQPVKK